MSHTMKVYKSVFRPVKSGACNRKNERESFILVWTCDEEG